MTTQTSQKNYFNLHTTGIGYLNDIREVTPKTKKDGKYLSCRIAALTGDSEKPEYRYFDCNVNGEEAKKLIKRCEQAVNDDKKVLISFVLADLWTDMFKYSRDSDFHKKGDVGVSLKARLIRIKMIKIDGELKYQETKSAEQASGASAE
ncbi:STY4534 family ICE replication protein [Exercitatus varius]|uniref:STY4534 family ICE replication protein n=1 Tax=Exercitatus varius TaxID=67857 RepID=UPI00294B7AC8|nr:STY4534 family ICE replication protein [Exercitatus varius]MDG2961733.1 STY4534 family ICE replication protein [Exercitatus varius]